MTNKKIDNLFKFILYFIPIIYMIVEYWLCVRQNGDIQSINDLFNMINSSISWTNNGFFSDFTTWVHTNISISNDCIDFILYYIYYACYVEMFVLLKNVLIFMFKVSEKWLQKGVDIV